MTTFFLFGRLACRTNTRLEFAMKFKEWLAWKLGNSFIDTYCKAFNAASHPMAEKARMDSLVANNEWAWADMQRIRYVLNTYNGVLTDEQKAEIDKRLAGDRDYQKLCAKIRN